MSSTTPTPTAAPGKMPAPPTLFLFDKITAFLNANATPPLIRVLALSNPKGELLAHSTNNSIHASVLRRQCAVAASIFPPVFEGEVSEGGTFEHDWGKGGGVVVTSRPGSSGSTATASGGGAQAVTVTIDDGSVVVIRRLSCGVLFISSGGGGGDAREGGGTQQQKIQAQADEGEGTTLAGDGGSSEGTTENNSAAGGGNGGGGEGGGGGLSKVDVLVLRRRVEELAKLLDGQLSTLYVPEDGVGIFSAPVSRFYGRVPPWRSG